MPVAGASATRPVEAHVGRGLPSLTLTGLPGAEVSRRAWPSLEQIMGVEAANQERLEFLGGVG
jgi:hypothetical protein